MSRAPTARCGAAALANLLCVLTCTLLGGAAGCEPPEYYATPLTQTTTGKRFTGSTEAETANVGTGFFGNTGLYQLRSQHLYLASELNEAGFESGSLTGLTIKVAGTAGRALEGVDVRLGTTNDLTLSQSWYTTTTMSIKIDADSDMEQADEWSSPTLPANKFVAEAEITFDFTSAYSWDGTSNLIVDFNQMSYNKAEGGGIYFVLGNKAGRSHSVNTDNSDTYPYTANIPAAVYAAAVSSILPPSWLSSAFCPPAPSAY